MTSLDCSLSGRFSMSHAAFNKSQVVFLFVASAEAGLAGESESVVVEEEELELELEAELDVELEEGERFLFFFAFLFFFLDRSLGALLSFELPRGLKLVSWPPSLGGLAGG